MEPVIITPYPGVVVSIPGFCKNISSTKTGCKLGCSSQLRCAIASVRDCKADGQCLCTHCDAFLAAENNVDDGGEYFLFTRDIRLESSDSVDLPRGLVDSRPLLVEFTIKIPYTAFQVLAGTEIAFEANFDFERKWLKPNLLNSYFDIKKMRNVVFTDGRTVSAIFVIINSYKNVYRFCVVNETCVSQWRSKIQHQDITQFKLLSENQEAIIISISH